MHSQSGNHTPRPEWQALYPDWHLFMLSQMSGQALRLAMTAVAGLHAAIEQATRLARRSGAAAVQWVSSVHA